MSDAPEPSALTALRLALVQLAAGPELARNLDMAEARVREAAAAGAQLVSLPENFTFRGRGEGCDGLAHAEPIPGGPILARFQALARELGVGLHLGSLGEAPPAGGDGRAFNTSVLLGPWGEILGVYRKIHLFDVQAGGDVNERESARFAPGAEVVCVDTPWGVKIGLSICYDLRFPELFRALADAGAQLVLLPANFTRRTGERHWRPLLAARAIENGLFMAAAAQVGAFPGGFLAHGHSLAVGPDGEWLGECDGEHPGLLQVRIDPAQVAAARARIPTLAHRRLPFPLPRTP